MRVENISDMVGGWYIGNFTPSVWQTEDFEVSFKLHKKNEEWPAHHHKVATEINYLVFGAMKMCDTYLVGGDIFVVEPNEVADPVFFEDCGIVCVKVPSVKGDKYEE